MGLRNINSIVLNNLAINIDISKRNSWDLNDSFKLKSLNKWKNIITCDAILPDYGLTGFDNGCVNSMFSSLELSSDDTFQLNRVGFNTPNSVNTSFEDHTILPITGSSVGNYFNLDGGYLQGFFKLHEYDYEQLPARYNNGISIETLLEILPQSKGIFYYMGVRAEDKYNPFFNGETELINSDQVLISDGTNGYEKTYSGYTTSLGNHLISSTKEKITKLNYREPECSKVEIDVDTKQVDNIKNNAIAFEITAERKIEIKFINESGSINHITSPNIIKKLGWTIINIVFKPYSEINKFDDRRKGDLIIYINGRKFWKITDFNEFYFTEINNDKEKQIGVPYNISWGGGSFGLKHSYHFFNDTIVKDTTKDNLTIEKYFNSSYLGNIQKLRVYDRALDSNEVLQNAMFEANNNHYLLMNVSKGGRIINESQPITYVPQLNAGSDIRKQIKYRNTDGTYRNLVEMSDIMVVVKSRSNENIELVKFRKTAGDGWLELIYVDIYTFEFIVQNTITAAHPNEMLFAEIRFQWYEDNIIPVFDKIFVINLTNNFLGNNTIKDY